MGRWVRWFGAETAVAEMVPPRPKLKDPSRLMQVSVAEAKAVVAGEMPVGARTAAAPTGQMSVQQLSAEMLTAVLVQEGALNSSDEHAALQEHRATGRPVEEILVESKKMTEPELVGVLSKRCKVPHMSLKRTQINEDVVKLVPLEFARANRLVPLQKLGKILNVATTNPLDVGTFKRLEEETGLRIKPMLAMPSELRECLDKHYPPPPEELARGTPEDEMKITVKDFLKESWLGAVKGDKDSSAGLPAVTPEQEAAASEEGEVETATASAAKEVEKAILMSDEEVAAFKKAAAAQLYREWTRSVGLGSESAGSAVPVSVEEFKVAAADAPAPKPERPAAKSSRSSSRSSRATRKKKRKKRRSNRG